LITMSVGTRLTIGFAAVVLLIWAVAGLCIRSYDNIHAAFEVASAEQKAGRSEELPVALENMHRAHQAGVKAVLLATALITALAVAAVFSITRSIVRPLDALSRGAEIIGRGNLDFKVGTTANDEIGHLSQAFDEMTSNLKSTTTSVDRLNREIDHGRQVEGELRSYREHLEELVEERTRTLQDEIAVRKQAELDLALEKEHLTVTLRSIGDGVIVTDAEGRILILNAVAEALTGWSQQEASGKPFAEVFGIVNEKTHQPCKSPVEVVLESGEIVALADDVALLAKNGTECLIADTAAPIRDKEGRIRGAVLVFRDVTESKRAQAERDQMQAQLYRAHKVEAIGLLAGGIAHDFNNLLSAVQGYSDLAMMQAAEGSPLRRYLEHIQKAGMQGAHLTRQLLIFSRKHPVEACRIDLNGVLREMLDMLDRVIRENIELSASLEADLWAIQGDKTSIEQVVMNLVLNARDAMPEGGEINIATENVTLNESQCRGRPESKPGNFVCLTVTDDGVGMDEAVIHHIFDPFFTTKEMEQGTGLGLAVAHSIVKYHDGWISVESEPGQGSTFKVYLPVPAGESGSGPEHPSPGEQCLGSGERILVVEDGKEVRGVISRLLTENGYIVAQAASSSEAVDVFRKEDGKFDVILSDMVLPDEDALHLVDRLLAMKPDLKVLLISGYVDERSMAPIIRARGFAFLRKPITLSDLLCAIRNVMNSTREKSKEPLCLPS
jgi:two-component system cell cycle sensor histidine kinase/response regulator CckA